MTTVSPPYIPTSAALPSCSPPPPQSSQPTSTSPTSSPPRAGLSAYQELSIIGEGTFGKVAKIKRISDGEILVWKELYYGSMSDKEKQQLVSEVNILREMDHVHIVKYYDRIIDRDRKKIYIIMEYCPGGDLASLIRRKIRESTYVEEEMIWKIFTQVGLALMECHRKVTTTGGGIVLHRDLKPSNIFLDRDGHVKLGDFGLARILKDDGDYARTHVGTPYYMSPEQVTEARYNEKSDIWSLGCLIYELASLHPPFKASNHLALAMKIQTGKFAAIPDRYSSELQRCLKMMIQLDPNKRPAIEQIMRFPRIEQQLLSLHARHRLTERELSLLKLPIPSTSPTSIPSIPSSSSSSRDAEYQRRMDDLIRREQALLEREKRITKREQAILEREQTLNMREKEIQHRTVLTSISHQRSVSMDVSPPSKQPSIYSNATRFSPTYFPPTSQHTPPYTSKYTSYITSPSYTPSTLYKKQFTTPPSHPETSSLTKLTCPPGGCSPDSITPRFSLEDKENVCENVRNMRPPVIVEREEHE